MRKLKTLSLIVFLFAVISIPAAYAEDGKLPLTPGLYTIVSLTSSNLAEGTKANTVQRCIRQTDIGTDTVMPDVETCQARNIEKTGSTVKFEMTCIQPDGTSIFSGQAEYSTTDDSFSFKYVIQGDYKETYMIITSEGNAKRVGECPTAQ